MCIFPLLILGLSTYVFPRIFASMDPVREMAMQMAMLLFLVVILTFGGFFLAAMGTFLLLEHKDEHTLSTIAVTPVGAGGYIRFKMAYIYLMSVLSNIVVLLGTKVLAGEHYSIGGVSLFDNLSLAHIISYALISALFAPTLALLQAAFAKNEVEGFAFIKGTGIVAPLPALLVLQTFYGAKQYLLGVFPNFWPTKAVMLKLFPIPASANLSYPLYLIIGGIYSLLILIAAYRFFLKRTQY